MLTRMSPAFAVWRTGYYPFSAVWRPNADAVAAFEPERQEAGGKGVDLLLEFPVGPADLLMTDNQCMTLGKAPDHPVEMHADRIADEWRVARPVHIAQSGHLRASAGLPKAPSEPVRQSYQ